MKKKKIKIDDFLATTLENNKYYNISLMPFDYVKFILKPIIIEQVKAIHKVEKENKDKEKNKLQQIIYTELYKLNISLEEAQDYFKKAILTDKFKNYLGLSFKYSIQYNQKENPYLATFIHLAQLFIADMCYEYLWRLENKKK